MKLTEIVSEYPIKEDDNLNHVDKDTEPPKGATYQREINDDAIKD